MSTKEKVGGFSLSRRAKRSIGVILSAFFVAVIGTSVFMSTSLWPSFQQIIVDSLNAVSGEQMTTTDVFFMDNQFLAATNFGVYVAGIVALHQGYEYQKHKGVIQAPDLSRRKLFVCSVILIPLFIAGSIHGYLLFWTVSSSFNQGIYTPINMLNNVARYSVAYGFVATIPVIAYVVSEGRMLSTGLTWQHAVKIFFTIPLVGILLIPGIDVMDTIIWIAHAQALFGLTWIGLRFGLE